MSARVPPRGAQWYPDTMTDEEKAAEIERLERLRAASEANGDGYRDRIKAIDARLSELRG